MATNLPEKGRSFVLKIGDGEVVETFSTVSGQRTTGLTINGEAVDVSHKADEWRQLLEGAAIKSISLSASGIFVDDEANDQLRLRALEQTLNRYQIVFQDGDVWEGLFLITSLEYTGEYNGAREFSVTLESSGEIEFTEVT